MPTTRRQTVMSRSIKLGHCVCDPLQPCPCDLLKQEDICQCAGEKRPVRSGETGLMQHVRKAGCASKIGQEELFGILSRLPPVQHPAVLVGTAAGDDAGIYRLNESLALVQTVDVFAPCVDDAFVFGQIAAANSLSDVYAMGGQPLSALSIIGFPIDTLPAAQMEAILQGGIQTLNEAACPLIGGHSINDESIKCGFAITGLIHPDRVLRRDNAQPGDWLALTKPLGTGMLAFASQIGRIPPDTFAHAQQGMTILNRDAAELMLASDAHACTDITGYGLAGHLAEMARNSQVDIEINVASLPLYDGVETCLRQELMPGAIERNQAYVKKITEQQTDHPHLPVVFDPQTSGGLLVACPPEKATTFLQAMHQRGHHHTCLIGRVTPMHAREARLRFID